MCAYFLFNYIRANKCYLNYVFFIIIIFTLIEGYQVSIWIEE